MSIAFVWVAVIVTSMSAEPLVFGDDPSEINVAGLANWFWGLMATVFILRSTIFRRPHELGYQDTSAYPWMTLVVAVIWIAAMIVSLNTPTVQLASDTIDIPVGAIAAPPIATGLTSYAIEFLIQGFAARNAGRRV